jgi:hypothetical protein
LRRPRRLRSLGTGAPDTLPPASQPYGTQSQIPIGVRLTRDGSSASMECASAFGRYKSPPGRRSTVCSAALTQTLPSRACSRSGVVTAVLSHVLPACERQHDDSGPADAEHGVMPELARLDRRRGEHVNHDVVDRHVEVFQSARHPHRPGFVTEVTPNFPGGSHRFQAFVPCAAGRGDMVRALRAVTRGCVPADHLAHPGPSGASSRPASSPWLRTPALSKIRLDAPPSPT